MSATTVEWNPASGLDLCWYSNEEYDTLSHDNQKRLTKWRSMSEGNLAFKQQIEEYFCSKNKEKSNSKKQKRSVKKQKKEEKTKIDAADELRDKEFKDQII